MSCSCQKTRCESNRCKCKNTLRQSCNESKSNSQNNNNNNNNNFEFFFIFFEISQRVDVRELAVTRAQTLLKEHHKTKIPTLITIIITIIIRLRITTLIRTMLSMMTSHHRMISPQPKIISHSFIINNNSRQPPNKRARQTKQSAAVVPPPATQLSVASLVSVRVDYRGRLQSFRVPRGFVFGDLGSFFDRP